VKFKFLAPAQMRLDAYRDRAGPWYVAPQHSETN